MKKIKFRAWDKENKEMIADATDLFRYDWTNPFTDDDYICMQFTGLHDKNGKEIYEGDILQLNNGIKIKVVFLEGFFGYAYCNDLAYRLLTQLLREDKKTEVIGNIYENNNLIK